MKCSIGGSTGEIPLRRAVIVAPAGRDAERWVQECLEFCDELGITVAATLIGRGWHVALEMVTDGRAEFIMVARERHLDPNRVPQLLVVEVEKAKREESRRRRKPGWRRRPSIIDR